MNHYEKYLDMLNNNSMVGGRTTQEMITDTTDKFSQKDKYVRIPYSWNIQNNILFRDRMFLKLIKLPPAKIKEIIKDKYPILIKCLMIQIKEEDLTNLTQNKFKFNEIYKEYIKYKTVVNENEELTKGNNVDIFPLDPNDNPILYIKDLIQYFMKTHSQINNDTAKSRLMDKKLPDGFELFHYVRSSNDRSILSNALGIM